MNDTILPRGQRLKPIKKHFNLISIIYLVRLVECRYPDLTGGEEFTCKYLVVM